MRRLIIFLIRKRLGLKLNEAFKFANQSSPFNYYFFTRDALIKMKWCHGWWQSERSSCSLNWLLDDNCKIVRSGEYDQSSGRW